MPNFLGFPYVNPITITSNQPAFTSDTVNLKRQSVRTGAQRWDLTINFRGGYKSNLFGVFMSHYTSRAEGTPFTLKIPQNVGVEDAVDLTDTPTVNGAAVAGDTSLTIDGGTFNLPAGLFITFDNGTHTKVYMVTETVTDGGTLNISPSLREAVPNNTTITASDVDITVFHNNPNSISTYDANGTQGLSWGFVEAL